MNQHIVRNEIDAALTSLKNNKAVDPAGIHAEMLKYGGEALAVLLTQVINLMFISGHAPSAIVHSRVRLIDKQSDTKLKTDPRAHRPYKLSDWQGLRTSARNTPVSRTRVQHRLALYVSIRIPGQSWL